MSLAADFFRSKTTWLGLTWVTVAITRGAMGEIAWPEAVQRVMEGLAIVFVRDALVKSATEPSKVMAPEPVEPQPVIETPFREEADETAR